MKLGMLFEFFTKEDVYQLKQVRELGFDVCQVAAWNPDLWTDEMAEIMLEEMKKWDVKFTSFWCGWSGPVDWTLKEASETVGIVPEAYRYQRMQELKRGSDFAKKLGIENVVTHIGFVPEEPSKPGYQAIISAIRDVAMHCKENGQYFLLETGEITPFTVMRVIEDVGTGNMGVNFDTANFICYGKANPLDALDMLGKYVRDVHAKDYVHPTTPYEYGEEVPIGEGLVDFPKIIEKLKGFGYDSSIIIERETTGEQRIIDIKESKVYLEKLLGL